MGKIRKRNKQVIYNWITTIIGLIIVIGSVFSLFFIKEPIDTDIFVSPSKITQGGSATLYLNIKNNKFETIEGKLDIITSPNLKINICEREGGECYIPIRSDFFLKKDETERRRYNLFIESIQLEGEYNIKIILTSKPKKFNPIEKTISFNVVPYVS